MNARTRYYKVFERELRKYSAIFAMAVRIQLDSIPTNKLLRVRKELKRRGTFFK